MPGGSCEGTAKWRPTRTNAPMLPFAQVCKRARAKATAASTAIRAGSTGRSVLDASDPDGRLAWRGDPWGAPAGRAPGPGGGDPGRRKEFRIVLHGHVGGPHAGRRVFLTGHAHFPYRVSLIGAAAQARNAAVLWIAASLPYPRPARRRFSPAPMPQTRKQGFLFVRI